MAYNPDTVTASNFISAGADPTGVLPCEDVLADLALAVSTRGGGTIYVPRGEYDFPDGGVTWHDNVNLVFEAGAVFNLGDFSTNALFIGTPTNVIFDGVTVQGTWATTPNDTGNRAVAFTGGGSLQFLRCNIDGMRQMSLTATHANGVIIQGCTITHSARDSINLQDGTNVIVTGNIIKYGGDNGIACSFLNDTPANTSLVISGNILEDTTGINCLAAKHTSIIGNLIKRSKGRAIEVAYEPSFTEGYSTSVSLDISGNEITDIINGSYAGLGSVAQYIYVAGYAQPGLLSENVFRPSNNSSGNAVPQPPFGGFSVTPGGNYDYNSGHVSATPTISGAHAVTITRNTCIRTLRGGVTPSSWGFNTDGVFTTAGWVNTTITNDDLNAIALYLSPELHHTLISDNILMPGGYAIFLLCSGMPDFCFEGLEISNNKIFNAVSGGIFSDANATLVVDIRILNNTINCDPFFLSTNRTGAPNGPFLGKWANAAVPSGIDISNLTGVQIGGNHFWNCVIPVRASSSVFDFCSDNFQHCNPVATGYNADNEGIGNISFCPNGSMSYVIEQCSPSTPATYGAVLNYAPSSVDSGSPPSTGTHIQGHFVPVSNPSVAAGKTLIGYYRATTGTGNVDGTDWIHSVTTIV